MKRFLAPALIAAVSTFGLVGCEDTSKSSVETKVTTPEGTKDVKDTKEVKESGTPPAEPVKAPEATPPK